MAFRKRDVFVNPECFRDQRRRLMLKALERSRSHPITAIDLSDVAKLGGIRETRRRAVRTLIDELRGKGQRICAGNDPEGKSGYWLARNDWE